ncbi:MAG: ribonuclease P protein component [Acidimicrobiia bacterium]
MTRVVNASPPERADVSSLRHGSDFDRVFKTGRRHRSGAIVVIVAPGLPNTFRFGLVVGRKVGGAVARNRVKRRIREALRRADPPLGIDVVVIGSREVANAPFDRLVKWLRMPLAAGIPATEQEDPSGDC